MKAVLIIFLLLTFSFSVFGQKVRSKNKPVARAIKQKDALDRYLDRFTDNVDFKDIYIDEWLKYHSNDNFDFFYNPSLMRRNKYIVTVWTQKIFRPSSKVIERNLYEIDCQLPRLRSIAGVAYGSKLEFPDGKIQYIGESADSWNTPKAKFETIIPETVVSELRIKICEYTK